MFQKNLRLLSLALVLAMPLGVAQAVEAQATPRNFDVSFQGCSEFIGTGPVSLAKAQAIVPSEFSIVNADGFAQLVVRISKCQDVSVDSRTPRPGTVAQIGITIFSLDGLGDINNYTLTYASDVKALVKGLRAHGLPAQHDADMLFEFTRDSNTTGNLLGIVTPKHRPTWYVYGRGSDPAPNSAFPFRAIWWHAKGSNMVRMDTIIPAIAFGNAEVSFRTPDTSVLTQLIGGNTIATFSGLSVRGVFDVGEMTVSR